jgi:hypothetical protein
MTDKKPDKTRNERQSRRREREKHWLAENGWTSWEALHTMLIRRDIKIVDYSESVCNDVNQN